MDVRTNLPAKPARFTDQLRSFIRARNMAYATEKTYLHWTLRFIRFHEKRHPNTMGKQEIEAFLSHLAVQRNSSISTQRTALNALVFLYRDFGMNVLIVRNGKGGKDRSTVLPVSLTTALRQQIHWAAILHRKDLAEGFGEVYMPNALAIKYRNADKETAWQFLFPAKSLSDDPRSGRRRRHHVLERDLGVESVE